MQGIIDTGEYLVVDGFETCSFTELCSHTFKAYKVFSHVFRFPDHGYINIKN